MRASFFLPLVLMLGLFLSASAQNGNLLSNGDFENDTQDWVFYTSDNSSASMDIIDNQGPNDSKVARVTINQADANAKLTQSELPVEKDIVYILTFWAKSDSCGFGATVEFSNSPDDSFEFKDTTNIFLTTSWSKYEAILPVSSPTDGTIQLSLKLESSQGVIYLDDFTLEKGAESWYDGAEHRIRKYRQGSFAIKVEDSDGNPVTDSIIIRQQKHEFPWGTAFDQSDSPTGRTYSVSNEITAEADAEVYQSERWASYLGYDLPAEPSSTYNLTIKLAEIYYNAPDSRLFDVYVDGQRVIQNLDKYLLAQGQYVAFDTTLVVTATDSIIKLEFHTVKDNASIMGIELADNATNEVLLRLNCGGGAITTESGNAYENDALYIDRDVVNEFPTEDDWRKATMLKYCNYGVCGNQFKWSGIEPNEGILNYESFENTISWFQKVGWDFRAHTLLWGGVDKDDHHALPQWVGNLPPDEMYLTCKMRVEREVLRYKGIVNEYDVINEPIHANYLQSQVGDSINWNSFKWAHAVDPDARLFINDYNVVEWQYATDDYTQLISRMLEEGAPIHGIGSQCHFGDYIDVPVVKARFDQLAQFDIPIKVTEFDLAATDMTQVDQAIETAKIMRLTFSHPAIEGFIFWGLFNPAWRETISNLYNADRTPRIVADTVYQLIHRDWNTSLADITNEQGTIRYQAFYGDYEVLVKFGDTWKQFDVSNRKENEETTILLSESNAMITSPELIDVRMVAPSQVELTFSKAMSDPTEHYRSFTVFDAPDNRIESAALKEVDSTTIVITMLNPIEPRGYITASYFPGDQTSADGGKLKAFGPVADQTVTPSYVSSNTSTDGRTISVDFMKPISDTSIDPTNFTVRVGSTDQPVDNATLSNSKDTIHLTLTNQILSDNDRVSVSYQSGSLKTIDGLWIASFPNKSVANNVVVPRFTTARTIDQNSLYIRFSGQLAEPTSQSSAFEVLVNESPVEVIGCELSSSNSSELVLTLSGSITSNDDVTVSYTPGSLASPEGIPVPAFTSEVTNNIVNNAIAISANQIRYYPNPVGAGLTIEGIADYQLLTVSNILGQTQIQKNLHKGNDSVEVNTSELNSGIYLVTLSSANQNTVFRIIKR